MIIDSPVSGSTFAIGSLPHREAAEAARFAWTTTDIPTMPTLPRRSPAEGMIAQVLVGLEGVNVGQYGSISLDPSTSTLAPVGHLDLGSDAFAGYRAFLAESRRRREARIATGGEPTIVKWQCTGPVTLALALRRLGLDHRTAFESSLRVVRSHILEVQRMVADEMPTARQLVVVDEPAMGRYLDHLDGDREEVADLVSGALAVVDSNHWTGVHSCGDCDWSVLFDIGCGVLSVPLPGGDGLRGMTSVASRVAEHLDRGGWFAWGVVRTDGPIGFSVRRPWKNLLATWTELAGSGVDVELLQSRSMLTPACGLGTHGEGASRRVMSLLAEVSVRVRESASAALIGGGS